MPRNNGKKIDDVLVKTLYSSTTWLRRCRQFPLTSNILKMKYERKRVSQRKRDRDRDRNRDRKRERKRERDK